MTLRQLYQRHFKGFQRDSQGTSAIEFGLIAPMLLVVVVGLADVNTMAYGSSNMQSAVRAGIHYAMVSGPDNVTVAEAQNQANAAWTRKPADGSVTAVKACKCAGAGWDCATFCPDQTRPETYITVTATGTLVGNYYSRSQTSTETVRIR